MKVRMSFLIVSIHVYPHLALHHGKRDSGRGSIIDYPDLPERYVDHITDEQKVSLNVELGERTRPPMKTS